MYMYVYNPMYTLEYSTHRFNGWGSDNPRRGDNEISEGAKVTCLLLELLAEAGGMVAVPTP